MTPRARTTVQRSLLAWFDQHRRDLPWRRRRTPYRVWISELMLQQTRVEAVIPYYIRFMKRFPDVRSLATAPRADVLKHWEGLGYYARARNAQDAARRIVSERAGRFPSTLDGLLGLPGIGGYTAAAIGSLALGFDLAVVDGNVARVLARLEGSPLDITTGRGRRQLQAWADELLVRGKAGAWNEAMMELGALCCVPRSPRCGACPLRSVCVARREGRQEEYPVKKRKSAVPHKVVGAGLIVNRKGQLLIAQRKESSMLGGLWEFPGGTKKRGETMRECIARELDEEMGIRTEVGARLMIVRHAYSHFTIALHAHWAHITRGRPRTIHCADTAWVKVGEMKDYAFSAADIHIIKELRNLDRIPPPGAWA